jgi:hypothetical protein
MGENNAENPNAGETGAQGSTSQAGTMFQPGQTGDQSGDGAGGDTAQGSNQGGDKAPEGDARPDWLSDKYKSVEDQAKAYNDMQTQFTRKTDDLRAEVRDEAVAEYGKTIGVPNSADDYAYPDGVTAPEGDLDGDLRSWAKENNVSPDGFQKLVNDVWMKTQPDHAAEKAALGEGADARLDKLNKWVTSNVDEVHFGSVGRIMQTADGVKFMEAMAGKLAPKGFAPDGGGPPASAQPKTRDQIREMQADPRFGSDPAYTAEVRGHWKSFTDAP